MPDPESIRRAFERTAKAVRMRPLLGLYTTTTQVRLRNGTTCDVEHVTGP